MMLFQFFNTLKILLNYFFSLYNAYNEYKLELCLKLTSNRRHLIVLTYLKHT